MRGSSQRLCIQTRILDSHGDLKARAIAAASNKASFLQNSMFTNYGGKCSRQSDCQDEGVSGGDGWT